MTEARDPALVRQYSLRPPGTALDGIRGGLAVVRKSLRARWSYRWSMLTALIANGLGYGIFFLIWREVYQETGAALPLSREKLFAYLALAFTLNFTLSLAIEVRFAQRLSAGQVAIDLMRPLGFLPLQLAQAVGEACSNLVLATPILVVAGLFLGQSLIPVDPQTLVLGCTSALLGFFVNFGICYLVAQWLWFETSFYGVVHLRTALHQMLSGLFAPLIFFPEALREIALVLPFHHVIETPVRVLLGLVTERSCVGLLLEQLLWAVGLLLAAQGVFKRAVRVHQIQGG